MKAAGIAYYSGNKVLLMKRRDEATQGGKWSFPAGKIEDGESAIEAAARESEEETGYRPDDLKFVSDNDGFSLFRSDCDQFTPRLNYEHTDFMWADQDNLPEPLHPGIGSIFGNSAMDSAQKDDINGFVNIDANPIIREGVFPYLGKSIDPAGRDPLIEPNKVYQVYRPASEISDPEALESFKMLPFVDEHAMLGPTEEGHLPAERKGVHGATGEAVAFKDGVVYSNIKIFSEALKNLLRKDKKTELSLGYRCRYEKVAGTFAGKVYDFIQRSQRGNHLALVHKGRNDVAVLDQYEMTFDHFDLNFTQEEKSMPTVEDLQKRVDAQDEAIKKLTTALDEMEKEKEAEKKAEDEDMDKKDEKKAEDESEAEKKEADKKAEDEDETKKDKEDKAAMDSAITGLKNEIAELKKGGIKAVLAEVSQRDSLAKQISEHVGTFDHSEMTLDEVATYGVAKLGLKPAKGQERAAIDGFLAGRKVSTVSAAMDSKEKPAGLQSYLNPKA